jgi:5,10-methylenetetrahydrofolate reductase
MKFSEIIKKRKVITVELNPPKGTNTEEALREISRIKKFIDAVNITDCPMARLRMSPIALSNIIRQRLAVETIFNLTCRDRNILGLQAELLGASAMGVENILAIYGDPPQIGDHPDARPVYEIDTTGLIGLARQLNNGLDLAGNKLEKPTNFFIGTTVNPTAQDLNREITRLQQKVTAGAHFAITQPVYDSAALKIFLEKIQKINIPIIVGVMPIKSLKFAAYFNKNVPGITIPQKILEIFEKTPNEDRKKLGLALTEKFILENATGVAGFHLMSSPVAEVSQFLEKIKKGLL